MTATPNPLAVLRADLERAHEAADHAVGAVSPVARGPMLDLRAEIRRLIDRTVRIQLFENRP